MSNVIRKNIEVKNDSGTLFVVHYTEEEIKFKGYKYGVYDCPNPVNLNNSLFQSKDIEECKDFAAAPRSETLVFVYASDKIATIAGYNKSMSLTGMWSDDKIRLSRFLLSKEISCEFYICGEHFGTFHKIIL